MVAVIGDASNAASVALHARAGFHEVGRLPGMGWKHGRWLEWLMMARPLGPGDTTPPL
jgi:phosphinothricin acetyltransferase